MTSLPSRLLEATGRFKAWLRSVLYYDHWMVGIVEEPIRNALTWKSAPEARWIEAFNPRKYHADPFPWPGSVNTLLCEGYDVVKQVGRIEALKLDVNGIADEMPLNLPLPGHLSFPFLFYWDGQVFLLPESSQSRRLELLRWQEEAGAWEMFALILDDKAAADPILFEKDGLFWIAYTDVDAGAFGNLNVLYAQNLAGPWQPHAQNPVREGLDSSRNAGPVFEVDGALYRPAQDCTRLYGGGIAIMRIDLCSPAAYHETQVNSILPSSLRYPDGFHTLVAWGDYCLVDGMRMTFSWPRLWGKIKKRLSLRP